MSTAVAITATAEANCAHVRELLAERQPRFATALEAATVKVSDAMTLHGTDWLHASHRAEVEAVGRRLDAALDAALVAAGSGEQ